SSASRSFGTQPPMGAPAASAASSAARSTPVCPPETIVIAIGHRLGASGAGVDGLFRDVRQALEVEAVPVWIDERCDPQPVAHVRPLRCESLCLRFVIDADRVRAHETDRYALS